MTTPFASLSTPRGLVFLRWAIGVVLVFGLIGCVVKGANNPPDPYVVSPSAPATPSSHAVRTRLAGFGETKISVQLADKLMEWCLLLAANDQQRARGLMQVTDPKLGGYDGMLFRYTSDVTESYWMRNTPMPLSIAFVSSGGDLVSTADMEPCADSPNCRNYPAAGPYRLAIEVPQGQLASLGIASGTKVTDENAPCS
ncbi:MAG TPA: DUF192 domain-containing protein [Acidimicrobiales bacterium]|nr:DUF192 domain-containing protein [Acidimicrobiales bacterium]